eukprot:5726335-Karenia_brevis.AAC.1
MDTQPNWQGACLMPHIDYNLRALVAVPFDPCTIQRLGVLRAELRRRHWSDEDVQGKGLFP